MKKNLWFEVSKNLPRNFVIKLQAII